MTTVAEIIRSASAAIKAWLHENALWLVGLGLMLASSGIDGAYMARLMSWPALGYVLNTTADVAGMTLTYYYGRLLRDNARTSNKHKQARYLIISEVVAVGYSWFFSWRQLRLVIRAIEPVEYEWIAVVSAAFIPLLLAFIGWAQSLIVTPPDATEKPVDTKAVTGGAKVDTSGQPVAAIVPPVVTIERHVVTNGKPPEAPKTIDAPLWRSLVAKMDGDAPMDATGVNQWLAGHGYEQKAVTTARRWAAIAQEAHNAKSR
jgi:hypothetical protein